VTSGDYLHGFFLGTRQAIADGERTSVTITIQKVSAFSVGVLIALFERAVGLYASLISINACDQPGVETGKRAAAAVIALQGRVLSQLNSHSNPSTVFEIASATGAENDVEHVLKICEHLSATPNRSVIKSPAVVPIESKYSRI
jgi:glucose-6-phosphate isomerase